MARGRCAHPLLGQMHRLRLEQIEESLHTFPPTREQAAAIADEEKRRPGPHGDRSDVYRALARTMIPPKEAAC